MNLESSGGLIDFWRQCVFPRKDFHRVRPTLRRWRHVFPAILCLYFCLQRVLWAQPTNADVSGASSTNSIPGTPEEQKTALQLQVTNAFQRVIQIVNQPVRAYVQTPDLPVFVYNEGWFHPGATRPNFDTVDVRQSQQFPYANQPYVTSSLNPGVVFMGADLEFNAMTKYFYVDRSVPKHRLSQAQMLEINRQYRIIGQCEKELRRVQLQLDVQAERSNNVESDTEPAAAANQPLASIQSIPKQTRLLYGGIAIGVLILLVAVSRLFRKRSD